MEVGGCGRMQERAKGRGSFFLDVACHSTRTTLSLK